MDSNNNLNNQKNAKITSQNSINNKIKEMVPLFPSYVNRFRIGLRSKKRSPKTILNYLIDIRIFFQFLIDEQLIEETDIKDISLSTLSNLPLDVVELYIAIMQDEWNYKSQTMNRKISALKSLFKYLHDEAEDDNLNPLISRNVMNKIKTYKQKVDPKTRSAAISGKILHDKEIGNFLDFVLMGYDAELHSTIARTRYENNLMRDLAILKLFLGSGIRLSELANLTVDDINFERNQILIYRKGESENQVPIDCLEFAMQGLHEYLEFRNKELKKINQTIPTVFLTKYAYRDENGVKIPAYRGISVRAIEKLVTKYTKAFNIKTSPHKLRHSFALEMYKKTGNLIAVKNQLGHSDITTTTLYLNLSDREMKREFEKMDKEWNDDREED